MGKMKDLAMREREAQQERERIEYYEREQAYLTATRGTTKQPGETAHNNPNNERSKKGIRKGR